MNTPNNVQNAPVSPRSTGGYPTYPTHARSRTRGVEVPYSSGKPKLPEVRFKRNRLDQIIPATEQDLLTLMTYGVHLTPTDDYREVIGMCRSLVWGIFLFKH